MVVDSGNHRLAFWRLRDGTVWRHIGSFGNEPGQFIFPCAIASTSSGALVVTDQHRVQVLTLEGAVLCVLDPTDVASVGRLSRFLPGVAVCPRTDEILVSDYINHRIVAMTWSVTTRVRVFESMFMFCGVIFKYQCISRLKIMFINLRYQIGLSALVEARVLGNEGVQLGSLRRPYGIVMTRTGAVWVADQGNNRLCLLH